MAPLATAGGDTLAQLALVAFVCGLLALCVTNPSVRAGLSSFLGGLRKNPVGRFFYGNEPAAQTPETPQAPEAPTPTPEVDKIGRAHV